MRSSTWRLEDLRNVILNLGFVGENLHTRQIFDCKKMFDQYPNASVSMTVTPPEGEPYPGTIERDGDLVIWDVRDSDLVAEGDGEIQLVFTQEPHIARSYNARTHICRSQVPTGSIPSGLDDYITRADQLLDEVEDTFPAGGTTGQVLAKKSDTDYDTEWVNQGGGTEDYDELENRPQIGGVTLTGNKTLHDLGAATEEAVNAKYTKPASGIPASDMASGVIPVLTDLIDDTAGSGDTNKVWSADKSSSLLTEINSRPESVGTDASGVDLDIVDPDGYVLARFKGGHFQTKNFDSEDMEKASATVFTDAEHSGLDVIDANGNVVLRLLNGDIQTKNFDSKEAINPVEYKFSGDDLLIGYGYNSTHDAVVVMNEGRANDLFDFSDLKLKPKGMPLSELETADLTSVWHSGTDMHGPFEFLAVNNPDGYHYDSTDPGWTGGVHTANIDGDAVKTAETEYIYFFADGHPVSEGYGKCSNFEIRWANDVQAWNCVKADGTGRTSLIEYHDMIFDGVKFTEQVRITPTEDIKMQLWYGFQGVAFDSVYTNIAFVDGENRLMEDTSSARNSGNNVTSGIIGIGSNHAVEITVDTNVDLGKRQYYSGTEGAFSVVSTGKVYFCLIKKYGSSQVEMPADSNYYLHGSYRFYPVVQ